ncbi:MAG: OmpA family protein [Deltaproteobacteria bacterium HGW-Deltaproteobacteria-19]|jgi:outer membrane protein OmpA-like peptidoglycan-associated protein|nr:MAG: OmpA family protein [Deltaproteobacteria bacterium HGW-Deltaproteobacteria-19]
MMRILMKTGLVVLAVLFAAGCATTPAPKSYAVLMDNQDGTVGQITVSGAKGEVLLDKPRTGADLDGASGTPYVVDEARINRDFGEALAARPPLPASFMLYYRAGGIVLTDESQALIPAILEAAGNRPAPDVSVIGHTDTVGNSESNEKLALQRAQSVAEIIRKAGLQVHDLTIASHGERNLLVATPDNTPEPKNRRVEVTVR